MEKNAANAFQEELFKSDICVSEGWRHRGIQRWSTLIQKCFTPDSALFIALKPLNSADSALNSATNKILQSWKPALNSMVSALISSGTAVNSADFWQIQSEIFGWFFFVFEIFKNTSISRHITLIFSPIRYRSEHQKLSYSIFSRSKHITKTNTFGFLGTAQVPKLMSQIFKSIFLFSGTKLCFRCHFSEYWEIYIFIKTGNTISSLLTKIIYFDIIICMC